MNLIFGKVGQQVSIEKGFIWKAFRQTGEITNHSPGARIAAPAGSLQRSIWVEHLGTHNPYIGMRFEECAELLERTGMH